MQQVRDFVDESESLAALLKDVSPSDWDRPTQFKSWTINDVVVHLTFWNQAANAAVFAPDAFDQSMRRVLADIPTRGFRACENESIAERGPALLTLWQDGFRQMGADWAGIDPKRRVKWVGPDMSARSSMTARQMETWAHGQAVFDVLGVDRAEDDRIRNIVILGMNTFGYAFQINGLEIPESPPQVSLTAPSGAVWTFGESDEHIAGSAVEFAQVLTQTRHIDDTTLQIKGPVARQWMQIAQCFAGGAEAPPSPGTRFRVP